MIHQLRPGKGVLFTTCKDAIADKNKHLEEGVGGNLIRVLEDLQKAAFKLVRLFLEKKLKATRFYPDNQRGQREQ